MKPLIFNHSRRLAVAVALACAVVAGGVHGQEAPDASPVPLAAKPRYAALENALALYSPFESPWAEIKANHAFESHLFGLMRAEVRLWSLQRELTAQEGTPARESADEIARIVHEQILAEAAEALPILQKAPNKAFAQLLVHQLEAYPSEWKEEGSEEVLPGLHKLIDPPTSKPAPQEGVRRRHRRRRATAGDSPAATPTPSTREGRPGAPTLPH